MASPYAFVTLVSSDAYLPGALAQAAALRDLHPSPPVFPEVSFQLICLVTPETVDITTIKLLRKAFDLVIGVEVLEQENNQNLQLLGRPDLTTVLTKLHVFRLAQYSKIVFLDADVLPIRPLSHLFNVPHEFAAAPDVGWPDIFNSGVLVLSPGQDKFNDLQQLLKSKGSWDGGDQGLLNEWRSGDWHRLSFTYNTTPTAAYTYAPAYERYGSQINAIHFIGPNKPWNSIPIRSPFLAEKRAASSSTTDSRSPQQAYNYESLVDRWYEVYDKHYRSEPVATPSFEVRRYTSAWDSPGPSIAEDTSGKPFTLEDLRRIAVEGMTSTGFQMASSSGRPGEGEYRTLPLEGRFDLMRPRKPPVDSEDDSSSTPEATLSPEAKLEVDYFDSEGDLPLTPMVRHFALPDDPASWHTLPTPRPDELPPSPKLPLKSLPGTPTPAPDYYASSAGPASDSDELDSGKRPANRVVPFPSHLFTQTPPSHRSPSQDTSQGGLSGPQYPLHSHHHPGGQHEHQHQQHEHHQNHRQSSHAVGKAGHQHDQQHRHSSRPHSPPLISWNPAIEPPPNEPPPHSNFPPDTYFTNAWDKSHRPEPSSPHKTSPEHPSILFDAPPPPQIPKPLREQGHYRNVTGEDTSGSQINPDATKVKPVFPWENQPRRMPGRVFPESDVPSPARFSSSKSSSQSQTPTPAPNPKPTEKSRPSKRIQPAPVQGLPMSLGYSNAWDTVPSIQNYASRLMRPPPVPLSEERKDAQGQGWDEKTEASSRDGDDEDEGDDEDNRDIDSDDDRKSRRHSQSSSSLAEDTRRVQQSAQKVYRSRGVQTISRDKRSQGVQVAVLVEMPPSHAGSRRSSTSSKRSVGTGSSGLVQGRDINHAPAKSGYPHAPNSARSRSASNGSIGNHVPAEHAPRPQREFITSPLSQPSRPSAKTVSTPRLPSPPRVSMPPRVSISKNVSPSRDAPPKPSPPPSRPSIQTNRHPKVFSITNRQVSNDSSIGSPPSSIGPVSPRDDNPFGASPIRKGTRVWDPARGVELFKRGSEEVLARFLKMGSWDENTRKSALS